MLEHEVTLRPEVELLFKQKKNYDQRIMNLMIVFSVA